MIVLLCLAKGYKFMYVHTNPESTFTNQHHQQIKTNTINNNNN